MRDVNDGYKPGPGYSAIGGLDMPLHLLTPAAQLDRDCNICGTCARTWKGSFGQISITYLFSDSPYFTPESTLL